MSDSDTVLPLPGDYAELITRFRDIGYEVKGHINFEPSKPHLLLRHDVDISIEYAHRLAEIEQTLGVHSCYFVLLRSSFYNPFAEEESKRLREIIEMGHEIGLHIDFSVYGNSIDECHMHVIREARILSELVDTPIYLVSFHRPSTLLRGIAFDKIKLPGFLNFYEPSLFRDIGFVSDLRGGWYHGHPFEHPAVKEFRALQLLTHPIWWIGDKAATAAERLDQHVEASSKELAKSFYNDFRILRTSGLLHK